MRAALLCRRVGVAAHFTTLAYHTKPVAAAAAASALCTSSRLVSSNNSSSKHATTTAAELRAALRTLQLAEDCTDAEVKRAFQAFAILHHPDTNAANSTTSDKAEARAAIMHRGTEAYHLLRDIPFTTRQRILKERCGGEGGGDRFRGPFSDFHFTEEEYAKAQRIYQGDRSRRRARRGGSGEADEELFDMRTEEGRRRAARFEELKGRIADMRRRGQREDLPPWRVYDNAGNGADAGQSSTASFNSVGGAGHGSSASASSAGFGARGSNTSSSSSTTDRSTFSSSSGGDARGGPRNPNRLGLHFFNATAEQLRAVRDLYRSRPGFAGMDGSSYDNPGSAARVAPELQANPHLRQYILMKQRAQEKAIVDKAVRRPLVLFLLLVSVVVGVLTGLRFVQSYTARVRRDEETRRREEERGGG